MSQDTISQSLEQIGWGKYQKQLFLNCSLAVTLYMGWPIFMGIVLSQLTDMETMQLAWIGFCLVIGLFIGCLAFSSLSDRYGRAFIFKRHIIVTIIGTFALAASPPFIPMIISSIILGIGVGGDKSLFGAVMLESCPPSRSRALTLLSLCGLVGIGSLVGVAILLEAVWTFESIAAWRIFLIVLGLFSCLSFWLRMSMLESPYFLYYQGGDEYKEVLRQIGIINESPYVENYIILEEECDSAGSKQKKTSNLKSLFKYELAATILVTFAHMIGNYSSTGLGMMLPAFLPNLTRIEQYTLILIQQFMGIVGMLIAYSMIDTSLGRRWTSASGYFGAFVFTLPLAFCKDPIIIFVSASGYYVMLQWGSAGINTITPESFPQYIRGLGVGFASSVSRISGIIAPVMTGFLIENYGEATAIYVFAACFFLQSCTFIFMKETRPVISRKQK